jgi:hypothetical protein
MRTSLDHAVIDGGLLLYLIYIYADLFLASVPTEAAFAESELGVGTVARTVDVTRVLGVVSSATSKLGARTRKLVLTEQVDALIVIVSSVPSSTSAFEFT